MYRYGVIIALLAATTVQATPLNLFSRSENGLVGDSGMTASALGGDGTSGVKIAIRSEDDFITGDLDLDVFTPEDGRKWSQLRILVSHPNGPENFDIDAIEARNPQGLDEGDDPRSLSDDVRKDFDKGDEQLANPIDIDGILPVDASGVIVDIQGQTFSEVPCSIIGQFRYLTCPFSGLMGKLFE